MVTASRESEPQEGKNENSIQIYFNNLDQDSGVSDARKFIPNKCRHSIILKKKTSSWFHTIPSSQGSLITWKLKSEYRSFLSGRWVLEIGLPVLG